MNIQDELILSYYKEIATLSSSSKIQLVQHIESKQIFVKKTLDVFNYSVYATLKEHPVHGIPKIYELIKSDSELIVIEDYISGISLEKIIETEGPMPEERVIKYVLQLCKIVIGLHESKPSIIHRDIKPTNIIITPTDNVVLIDLDAAKQPSDSDKDTVLLGTMGYAAPEQFGFGSSGIQTDIYAMGILINTLLRGSFSKQPVSGRLNHIIRKCTELNPADRYKDVKELQRVLYQFDSSPDMKIQNWTRFLPPGFRNGNFIHMIIASAYYLFTFWIFKDIHFEHAEGLKETFEKIGTFLMFIAVPFFTCNYLEIHKKIPLCKSDNFAIKLIGIILYNILLVFSIMFITLVLAAIFS